jgi:hypothetical protein
MFMSSLSSAPMAVSLIWWPSTNPADSAKNKSFLLCARFASNLTFRFQLTISLAVSRLFILWDLPLLTETWRLKMFFSTTRDSSFAISVPAVQALLISRTFSCIIDRRLNLFFLEKFHKANTTPTKKNMTKIRL